eukprot:SAG31_NODE_6112_length_2165_cov_8.620039_2_plen_223_part_00
MRRLKKLLENRVSHVRKEGWEHIVYNQSVAVQTWLRTPTAGPTGNVEHAGGTYRPPLDNQDARVRPTNDVAAYPKLDPDDIAALPDSAPLPYYARPVSTWTASDLFNWLHPHLPTVASAAYENGVNGELASSLDAHGWMNLGATNLYASEIAVCIRALQKARPLQAHLGPDQVSMHTLRRERQAEEPNPAVVGRCADLPTLACVGQRNGLNLNSTSPPLLSR